MGNQIKRNLAKLFINLIGLMPLFMCRGLGRFLGARAFALNIREAKITRENIALCFPDMSHDDQAHMAKASMANMGMLALDVLKVMSSSKSWAARHIKKIHGEDVLAEAKATGKGLLFIGPHLGNWEVVPHFLPDNGKTTILYQPPKKAYLESLIVEHRARQGATVVPTDQKGIATILKALRKGEIVGILPDQIPSDEGGEFSTFYGQPTFTMTFIHKLMQKTRCTAIYMFVKQVPGGFEIFYHKAPEELYSDDLTTSLAALNQGVEGCIAECPEQYQWEYKRFRKVPKGDPARYHYKK